MFKIPSNAALLVGLAGSKLLISDVLSHINQGHTISTLVHTWAAQTLQTDHCHRVHAIEMSSGKPVGFALRSPLKELSVCMTRPPLLSIPEHDPAHLLLQNFAALDIGTLRKYKKFYRLVSHLSADCPAGHDVELSFACMNE